MVRRVGPLFRIYYSSIWFLLFGLACLSPPAATTDIVAIIPDRSTAYPNGLHNGFLTAAARAKVTLDVRDVGDFDPAKSLVVLREAIESTEQPKIYCIWPVDVPSRHLIKELHDTHGVPIIQLNQLPEEWEFDHLVGYAGPDDALRARNAGIMMMEAMAQRRIVNPKLVALGYPSTYGGYHLSIEAFREATASLLAVEITHDLPLDWGNQPAYEAMVRLMDELEQEGKEVHGVYAMDDNILIGAYEALNDRRRLQGGDDTKGITLVGTVCNGDRDLLAGGAQYGTTIQSPYLEAALAIDSAFQYLRNGSVPELVRYTPNPMATGENWNSMVLDFLGEVYAADSLCTWNLFHERRNGLRNVDDARDVCEYVECSFVPTGLFIVGYCMAGFNYLLCVVGGILLFVYRKKKIVSMAQPFFLALVIVGAAVDTTSILFMSRDNRNYTREQLDRSCFAWSWLLALGQMMTTTTLVAKIYRVKAVIGVGINQRHAAMRRSKIHICDVSKIIIAGLLVDVIILSVWYSKNPLEWVYNVVSRDHQDFILEARGECGSDADKVWVYPLVILLVHFALLVYANVLAWETRKYHVVSDSRMVAVSLFNSIQLLLVASIMVALSGDNVSISYVIRASYAFLNNVGVLALVVGPKLLQCLMGQGDVLPDLHLRSSAYDTENNLSTHATRVSGLFPRSQMAAIRSSHQDGSTSFVMRDDAQDHTIPREDDYPIVEKPAVKPECNPTNETKVGPKLPPEETERVKGAEGSLR